MLIFLLNILKRLLHSIFVYQLLVIICPSNSYAASVENFSGTYQFSTTGGISNLGLVRLPGTTTVTIIQNGNNFNGFISGSTGFSSTISGVIDNSNNFTGTQTIRKIRALVPTAANDSATGSARFPAAANDTLGSGNNISDLIGSTSSIFGSFSSTLLEISNLPPIAANDSALFAVGGSPIRITTTYTKISNGVTGTIAYIQQSRQIIRATNSLISQHLATEVANAFSFTPGSFSQNTGAASSDKENWSPDSFWGTSSFSEIHEDIDSIASFDTDIYQFVGGFDKKIGRFFVGSAFTYAYAETEQQGQDSSSHVFGITPYGAYQITDYMFISALAGYNYTSVKDEIFNTDIDVHDYILEGNLNFYQIFLDSIFVKTRMGARFHHTYVSSTDSPLDATTDELMWLGDFELGYRFKNSLTTHIGTYYEYFDREDSTNSFKEHDGILYMRGGFDYPLTRTLTIGGKVQADLTDEDTDIITGSINIRLTM